MYLSYIKTGLFLGLIILLNACTDVVDIDLQDGGQRLVVEANIKWEKGTTGEDQVIKLSQSTQYFDQNAPTILTGALVTVTKDDDNSIFTFNDQNDGNYLCSNFVPQVNQSYTLRIVSNGKTYSAKETLIPVPEIVDVTQSILNGFFEEYKEVILYFQDDINENNSYLTSYTSDAALLPEVDVFNDRFTNGNLLSYDFEDEDFETGLEVTMSLEGISKNYYQFMNILIGQSGDGGPFATTPVQLKSNCKNVDDETEEVLGYFRLSEIQTLTVTIE